MKRYRDRTDNLKFAAAPKVTVGTFDGVHCGHLAVLRQLVAWARATQSDAVVITFDRRPRETLAGLPREHITSLDHRLRLLERAGVDAALILTFDERLAGQEPEDFVREVIVNGLRADGVLLGHDTRFGRNGRGNLDLMKRLAMELGLQVCSVPVVTIGDAPVSSTRVRNAVKAGELEQAASLLGRPVSTLGTVVRGTGRGKGFGYPTANLNLHGEVRLPEGVYATRTGFGGVWYDSVTNIGRPPRLDHESPGYLSEDIVIESYLLDYDGDIYGRTIEVRFLARLRDEVCFDSPRALRQAIIRDVEQARASHAADTDMSEPLV